MKHSIRTRCLALASLTVATASVFATAAYARTIEVNILYVHGVKNCSTERQNAQNSLVALDTAIGGELAARISSWQTAHPGDTVVVNRRFANLYTATPSPYKPSDSNGPLNMDDWEIGDPGCTTTQQGDPCTTAYEWRQRLVNEINYYYPSPRQNIVLVGHSTGGRVAMEVAANVGANGAVGGKNWGVQSRIAGVVSIHGMIDSLGTSKYNVVGTASFETTCKNGDALAGFGNSCAQGNGWCQYAARVTGFPAADWVAQNKRALMLTSWASCSPSLFTGWTDGPLPYDAQASPMAVGVDMTAAPNKTYRRADGIKYASVCHSAITNTGNTGHVASRDAAKARILDWLFVAAPKTAASGTNSTTSLSYNQTSSTFTMGSSCATGEVDDTRTSGNKGKGIDVVGVCKHPGYFDGDDHAVALSEIGIVSNGSTCNGSYNWKQAHDSGNSHSASLVWKTRSLRSTGPDLINSLP
jgi:pimeloyl-ACP methyl ester carboxylesterase